jgi:CBS-domain-containing membrane protein
MIGEYVTRPPEYWLNMAGKLSLSLTQAHSLLDGKMNLTEPYMTLMAADKPSFLDLMQAMASGCHRVAIVDESGRICRIVSQSAVIGYLLNNPELLGDMNSMKISELGFPPVQVLKVPAHVAALDAFHLIAEHNVSGVAVIDDEGRLLAVVEDADLKRMTASKIQDLTLPVVEYLAKQRRGVKGADWNFAASLDDTVQQTLKNFSEQHVHRLFITNEAGKPCNMVSVTDIINFILAQSS